MPDKDLSNYVQNKRERGVLTETAFDKFVVPETGDPLPTAVAAPRPAAAPKRHMTTVQSRLLAQKAKASGLNDAQIEAVTDVGNAVQGGDETIGRVLPTNENSGLVADNMSPAGFWSATANGIANTFTSFNAGVRQLSLGMNPKQQEVDAIRQWQKENDVQLSAATKRMLAADDLNLTKFGFGVGNAVGSVAISLAPALLLAPTGIGVAAVAFVGAAASYPMVFNSTFNSAIDAGYSPQDAARYAHLISVPISAMEMFPVAKIGRTLTSRTMADLTETALTRYLGKKTGAQAIAGKIAAQGKISDDVMVDVYQSVRNGMWDRFLINGGSTLEAAAFEGGTEAIQNYMEKFGEVGYDDYTNRNSGKGGFGTTMEDVKSRKQFLSAMEDGMYGAIAGGGMSITAIGKPIYEQGVYNTLAKYDQRGKLDEGIAAIQNALQAQIDAQAIEGPAAEMAMKSVQRVATAYKKLGGNITDPKIKAAMFHGVRTKDELTEQIAELEAKRQEVAQKIGTGEVDPDVAGFEDKELEALIQQKNKQFAFTSDWLRETSSQIYANRINAAQAQQANIQEDIENLALDAQGAVDKQAGWKKAMGFTPDFASVRVEELGAGLKAIQKEFESQNNLYSQEALKDKNLISEFDVFDTASKVIVDRDRHGVPSTSKGSFVHDGDGNYAVVIEQQLEDGSKKKVYRPVPKNEYYQQRLSEIFTANKQFETIAQKMVRGEELTKEEEKVALDFEPDVQEVFQGIKQKSDERIDNWLTKIAQSENPNNTQLAEDSSLDEFEKKAIMERMSDLKVTAPALLKAVKKGRAKGVNSILSKNPDIAATLKAMSEDKDALEKFVTDTKPKKAKKEKAPRTAAQKEAVKTQIENQLNGTKEAETGGSEESTAPKELTSDELGPTLGASIKATNDVINTLTGNTGLISERRAGILTDDTTLTELERQVDQINQQADSIYEQEPGNESGNADTAQNQDDDAGSTETETAEEFQVDSPLQNFVNSLKSVFNIDIEIVPDDEWGANGLRDDANGVFIGAKGKILVRDMPGAETVLLQELGHVAVAAIKKSAPQLYKQALNLVKGTKYEEFVRREYSNLTEEEDILREALGWAIQDKGKKIRESDPERSNDIVDMVKRIFKRIGERIRALNKSWDTSEEMTLDKFSNEIASKILSGEKFDEIFDNYIEEYQPDPTAANEYSLFGGHVRAAHQAPQMPVSINGNLVTPESVFALKTMIESLEAGTSTMSPAMIEDAIKNQLEPIMNSPKNAVHKWTTLTPADLSTPIADKMYQSLASGVKMKTGKSAELLKNLKKLSKNYSKWVRSSHARVIDNTSGRPVETYSYIDHEVESRIANDNVNQLKSANNGVWGKINQFFLGNYFTNLFGIETIANFLGGETGVLGGIHGLIRKRNNTAATFAKYAHDDIEVYKRELEKVLGLKTADEYFQSKVSISAFNNMDGNPTPITMDIPLGMAADILVNHRTQSLNAPGGVDRTHSSLYYDPASSLRGAKAVDNGTVVYRGITQKVNDDEVNFLFDDAQLAALEALFAPGTGYEFIVDDAMKFYSSTRGGVDRFALVNDVYINVKGESLKRLPAGTYAPTRVYASGSNASHRSVGAAYDDVSFIKPRTDLPARLQGSRDTLTAMESYNRRAQNFIRNAEAAESLLVYQKRVKDKWNNKEMQSKLDWLEQYRKDLNSYEQDRVIKGEEENKLGIPLTSYRKIMSNFAKAVFAFNAANPLKQSVGYLGAYGLGIIDNKYLKKYQGYVLRETRRSYKGYLAGESGKLFGQLGGRVFEYADEKTLLNEIASYDQMSDIWLRLEDITSNTQGVPVDEIYSAYNTGEKGAAVKQFLGQKWDEIIAGGLAPMRHSDRVPILGFYLAAKEQVRDMAASGQVIDASGTAVPFSTMVGGVEVMTPEAAQMVADKVTEVTYRTNNMYMSNDKTGLQRSHGFLAETIGLFSSQPQKIFNLFLQNMFSAARTNFTDTSKVKIMQATLGYSIILSAALTATITVAYTILKNGGLDDDDEPEKDLAVEFAKNIVGIAPSLGTEAIVTILSMFDSRGAVDAGGQNPVLEQITKLAVGLNSFKDSFGDSVSPEMSERLQGKAASEISSGLGSMLGVPTSFIKLAKMELSQE